MESQDIVLTKCWEESRDIQLDKASDKQLVEYKRGASIIDRDNQARKNLIITQGKTQGKT